MASYSLKSMGGRLTILQCKLSGLLYRALVFRCPRCVEKADKGKGHDGVLVAYYYKGERQIGVRPCLLAEGRSIDEFSLLEPYDEVHSCGLRGSIKAGHWIDHGH